MGSRPMTIHDTATRADEPADAMGQSGMQFGGTIPQQYRTSLHSVVQAIQVCG